MNKIKGYIGTKDAAEFCQVTRPTIRKWIEKGLIEAYLTPGGTAYVSVKELIKKMKSLKMPVPDELVKLGLIKVLVVDDEPDFTESLVDFFSKNDTYQLEVACNGYEACLKAGLIQPDFILLDIVMPGMNGLSFLKLIKEREEITETRICLLTGNGNSPEAEEMMSLGAEKIFHKPVDFNEITKYFEGIK